MDQRRRSPLLGSLTVVVSASLFGMLGVLSRQAYALGMDPFGFVAWRAGVGAVAIAALVGLGIARGGRLVGWRSLDGRGRASLATASLMGATLNMAMFLAFERIPIAIVLLCFYLYPAIVAAASAALGWEPLDRPRVLALAIALAGMVAVVVGGAGAGTTAGGTAGGIDPIGVALGLSAALSQAAFVLVSRHGYRKVPTDQAMATILAASAIIAGLVAVTAGGPAAIGLPLGRPSLLGLLLFAGCFAAAIPSFLFLAGIRWIGPVRAGILMLVEPLIGVALAAAFLDESIGPIQAVGGAAILVAAVIIQRTATVEPTITPAAEPEPRPEPQPDQPPDLPLATPQAAAPALAASGAEPPGAAASGSEPPGGPPLEAPVR